MRHDIKTDTVIAHGLSATLSGTTPATGNIVDLADAEGAMLVLQTGTVTDAGTASGFTTKLQESDTTADADFTDVAAADLNGTELAVTDDADDSVAVGVIGYIGNKRYVRAVATGTTGTNAVINGTWVLQKLRYAPAATQAAANIAAT